MEKRIIILLFFTIILALLALEIFQVIEAEEVCKVNNYTEFISFKDIPSGYIKCCNSYECEVFFHGNLALPRFRFLT